MIRLPMAIEFGAGGALDLEIRILGMEAGVDEWRVPAEGVTWHRGHEAPPWRKGPRLRRYAWPDPAATRCGFNRDPGTQGGHRPRRHRARKVLIAHFAGLPWEPAVAVKSACAQSGQTLRPVTVVAGSPRYRCRRSRDRSGS